VTAVILLFHNLSGLFFLEYNEPQTSNTEINKLAKCKTIKELAVQVRNYKDRKAYKGEN
jgi:hypothetical protein